MKKNRAQERLDEQLSAYIDGALSPRERARLEKQLAADPALRARLEALRQTVMLVRGLPPVRAPRNFLVTPSMVSRPARPIPWARRLAPALSFATAISAILCVVLLVANFLPERSEPQMAAPLPSAYSGGGTPVSTEAPIGIAPLSQITPQAFKAPSLNVTESATETPAPAIQAASGSDLETPSMIESAPTGLGEGGGAGGIGGDTGGGGYFPPGAERSTGEISVTSALIGEEALSSPQATPGGPIPTLLAPEVSIAGEEIPSTPVEGTPVPMGPSGPGLLSPTLVTAAGMAMLTALLTIITIRAWRAH